MIRIGRSGSGCRCEFVRDLCTSVGVSSRPAKRDPGLTLGARKQKLFTWYPNRVTDNYPHSKFHIRSMFVFISKSFHCTRGLWVTRNLMYAVSVFEWDSKASHSYPVGCLWPNSVGLYVFPLPVRKKGYCSHHAKSKWPELATCYVNAFAPCYFLQCVAKQPRTPLTPRLQLPPTENRHQRNAAGYIWLGSVCCCCSP